MSYFKSKIIALSALAIFTFGTVGCGYILYPERRNQVARGGRLDVAVVIMDILWLIPGIVPGVFALIWDGIHGSWYVTGAGRPILQNAKLSPLRMHAGRDLSLRGAVPVSKLVVRVVDAKGDSHALAPTPDDRGNLTLRLPGAVGAGPGRLLIAGDGHSPRSIPILVD